MTSATARSPLVNPALLLAGTALACLAAVGIALVTQYRFDMQPCPWCVLQRLIFLVIAAVCLLGLAWRKGAAALALVLAACGAASALWQHFVAASSTSCIQTFADKVIGGLGLDSAWPDVFSPRASCAEAAVKLVGIQYDLWSLALFVLIGVAAIAVLRAPSRR
jgi:disulfide bond formation protein DsbB